MQFNQKFRRNPSGVLGGILILCCVFFALFAYIFAIDQSQYANQMHLPIHSQPPGFEVQMLHIPNEQSQKKNYFSGNPFPDKQIPISSYTFTAKGIEIVHYNPETTGRKELLEWSFFPSAYNRPSTVQTLIKTYSFPLGTDLFGRDVWSRILVGARVSLSVGAIAVCISLLVGIPVGAIGGYFGGKIDKMVMFIINITWSIPTLLLVIAISIALGKGIWQVFIAVGLTMWVEVARIVRGQVMQIKEKAFVTAASVLGFSSWRILTRHILPNCWASIIVISAANFAAAILIESGLSFLGIGAQPPIPSWGSMIKDHYPYLMTGKAYMAVVPGIAIVLLVSSFMLVGNALRDTLDITTR